MRAPPPLSCLLLVLTTSLVSSMSQLYSESAKATARIEASQHLAELERQGVLGIKRGVKIRATRWAPDSKIPQGAKVIHLIRHGQGFHNLLGDLYRDFGRSVDSTGTGKGENPYARPELLDPPLTAIGREQAKALRDKTKELPVDLVTVSPLARAVQTAQLAMPHLRGREDRAKWIAHPDVAETSGANICDRRRDKAEIMDDFPFVDFQLIESEQDDKWTEIREEARSVSDRGFNFLLWVRQREEVHVAVATHSAWLFTLLNTCITCEDPELNTWFLTGELRSLVVQYEDASGDL